LEFWLRVIKESEARKGSNQTIEKKMKKRLETFIHKITGQIVHSGTIERSKRKYAWKKEIKGKSFVWKEMLLITTQRKNFEK
jgi:hypothetical protein